MTKTEQQKRFEAAWHIKWPNDEPFIFQQDSKGQYTWPEVQDTFEGFALGIEQLFAGLAQLIQEQHQEIERLKGLYNPELVPAAAHMIVTQRDEIARLKGLLMESTEAIQQLIDRAENAGEVTK